APVLGDFPQSSLRYSFGTLTQRNAFDGACMATIVKTPSGTWKALIRKTGWPPVAKTFRTKRDAEDWSRRTEDEMVRGVYIQRAPAERMTVAVALKRYLKEVTPTKRPSTQVGEHKKAQTIINHLG